MVKLKSRLIKHRLIKLIRERRLMPTFTIKNSCLSNSLHFGFIISFRENTDTQRDLFA